MSDIVNILTNEGSSIIARALSGDAVTFTSVAFGDDCYTGDGIQTAKQNSVMKTGSGKGNITNGYITKKTTTGSVFTITVTFDNSTFTGNQTVIKQIGIFAKSASQTNPVLFGYLSMGSYGTDIVKSDVQSIIRQFDIPYAFGQQSSTLKIVPYGYVSSSDTSTTASPNKLIYTGQDGVLPVSISGSAGKLDGHTATYFAIAQHSHDNATSTSDGFMSKADKSTLDSLKTTVDTISEGLDQQLSTTSSPQFAGLTVNGVIRGARFE